MNLDLLTIANRARLASDIQSSIANAKDRISNIKVFVSKIKTQGVLSKEEITQEYEFSIIGIVSILEQHLNDLLYHLYIAFPSKMGGKKFDINELEEKGSLLELLRDKAAQKVLDLAYGRFDRYMDAVLSAFDIKSIIDKNLIDDVNEIKCTRDCLIHSKGKSNALYLSKAGLKSRVSYKNERLKIDNEYFIVSADKILELISQIETLIPDKYKELTYAYAFKQMWEASCLNNRFKFEDIWEITSPSMVMPLELENDHGFSSSELAVYNLFRYIYSGRSEYKVDFALYFERWTSDTNEYQFAISWLNNQFFF